MNLKSARQLGINTIKVIEPNDAIYELDQILERKVNNEYANNKIFIS